MSNADVWADVDRAFEGWLLSAQRRGVDGALLGAALERSRSAGLPEIQVSALLGKALHVLALACGASRVLEIGTLGGYSTIWLARAVGPSGRVVTLEIDPVHASVARGNFDRAGVGGVVELLEGDAHTTLAGLTADGAGPFDMVFIDADKESSADYVDAAIGLSRRGALLVVDNVVRGGRVANPEVDDPSVIGVRRMMEMLAKDDRLVASALQTVGVKGYDGLLLAVVA